MKRFSLPILLTILMLFVVASLANSSRANAPAASCDTCETCANNTGRILAAYGSDCTTQACACEAYNHAIDYCFHHCSPCQFCADLANEAADRCSGEAALRLFHRDKVMSTHTVK